MFCRQYRVIASAERNFIRIPIKFQYTRRFSSFPLFHLTIFQSFFPLFFSFNIKPIWIIQRWYVYSRRSLFFSIISFLFPPPRHLVHRPQFERRYGVRWAIFSSQFIAKLSSLGWKLLENLISELHRIYEYFATWRLYSYSCHVYGECLDLTFRIYFKGILNFVNMEYLNRNTRRIKVVGTYQILRTQR